MSTPRPVPFPFIAPVAGVSFRAAEVRQVVEGDLLWVRHEEDNPHDVNACVVERLNGTVLGHLPREIAARLVLREEKRWPAVVAEVLRGETWGLRVRVAPDAHETQLSPEVNSGGEGSARAERREQPALAGADPTRLLAKLLAQDDTDAPAARGPVRTVKARSGRVLGEFLGLSETRVRVRNPEGNEVVYPGAAVRIEPPL